MNYSELSQALQDYLETTETSFVSNIPTFVKQAEQRIYRSVMIPELQKNVSGNMTAGNQYLARPSDFLSVFSMAVVDSLGNYNYLYDKDVNFIREAYPYPATSGVPKYYAQYNGSLPGVTSGSFILGPTPDASYAVELQYYYDPPSIVDTGTSWLGDNASTALLYGSLVEAYTYLKGDADMLNLYTGRYSEAMRQLFGVEVRGNRDDFRDGELHGGGTN